MSSKEQPQEPLIGIARRTVRFSDEVEEFGKPENDLKESVTFLKQCHDSLFALERERKIETEKLHDINTDIVNLENLLKSVREDYETKKQMYIAQLARLQMNIINSNQLSRAAGVPEEYLLDDNVLAHIQKQENKGNSEFVRSVLSPADPFNIGVYTKRFEKVPEKECKSCGRSIHRNSPMCPWCKSKVGGLKSKIKKTSPPSTASHE